MADHMRAELVIEALEMAVARRSSVCLSAGEREEISRGLACGDSCRHAGRLPPVDST
jgi:hypothetical protein